ncbi:PREDICTED: myosin regulatory light chain 2, ventricular/cardiac muscle isoform [Miniopterus natalensis]|uniref:myosin regulatory light chain 2, ventricular/cardiac muscle isoform n=1 Tax=Miniopterus natalensis TaxID=291302 RepID=UPI0007A6DFA1|nr:PREDICTED: myosin regulatory light chain 2, ventricular/cardiac muscle isoform [Miniopterus natalensis]
MGLSAFKDQIAPKKAKKRAEGANSNVFSMFEQTQIQEFKEAFTIMDQNRDGFIDKNDLRDTFAALGRVNVKNEEIDDMIKEAPGPINFTVFLTMFGEKLKGADPEETILNAFKVFDPEGKGVLKADYIKEMLTTQAERFSNEEVTGPFGCSLHPSSWHHPSGDSHLFSKTLLTPQRERTYSLLSPYLTAIRSMPP